MITHAKPGYSYISGRTAKVFVGDDIMVQAIDWGSYIDYHVYIRDEGMGKGGSSIIRENGVWWYDIRSAFLPEPYSAMPRGEQRSRAYRAHETSLQRLEWSFVEAAVGPLPPMITKQYT